jgi:hypothetical protein
VRLAEIFVASAILPSVGAFARDNVMSDESKQNGEPTSHHSWFQPLDRHPALGRKPATRDAAANHSTRPAKARRRTVWQLSRLFPLQFRPVAG